MSTFKGINKFKHGHVGKLGILVVNLGTPDEPTVPAVRRYLGEFLSDKRVVEIPSFLWKMILHGIILRVRPAKSARAYESVWSEGGSPLMVGTQNLTTKIARKLKNDISKDTIVLTAMRYGQPSIAGQLDYLKEQGVERIMVLPLYPQYSGATTGTVNDAVFKELREWRWVPELRILGAYHDNLNYIKAVANSITRHWGKHGKEDKLLISFHGMPKRTLNLGDPYFCHCHKTARLIAGELNLKDADWEMMFQSRFGKAEWLQPYVAKRLTELPKEGTKNVAMICPGFAIDCLETLEEIQIEGAKSFKESGGDSFHYIPCLNENDEHVNFHVQRIIDNAGGWPELNEQQQKNHAEQRLTGKEFATKRGAP